MPEHSPRPGRMPKVSKSRPLTPTAPPPGTGGSLAGFVVPFIVIAAVVAATTPLGDKIWSAVGGEFSTDAPERSNPCPRPDAGAENIDDARTDCEPLLLDRVYDVDPTYTILGRDYAYLGRDEKTSDCAALGLTPEVRAALTQCTRAMRVLLATPDGATIGAATLLVFDSAAQSMRTRGVLDTGTSMRVGALATPPDAPVSGLPPLLDSVDGAIQTCKIRGRYVLCEASASSESASAAREMRTDIGIVASNVVVLRDYRDD